MGRQTHKNRVVAMATRNLPMWHRMQATERLRNATPKHKAMKRRKLTYHPLSPSQWDDFEALFGPRGACGGCWCMVWRLPRKQWEQQKGDGNRKAMQGLVK